MDFGQRGQLDEIKMTGYPDRSYWSIPDPEPMYWGTLRWESKGRGRRPVSVTTERKLNLRTRRHEPGTSLSTVLVSIDGGGWSALSAAAKGQTS